VRPSSPSASALFGLIQVLNPVDYFEGSFPFAWEHGLVTFTTLHYGFLKERFGGILAPVLVHAVVDLSEQLIAG